jgi:hypothetical protein
VRVASAAPARVSSTSRGRTASTAPARRAPRALLQALLRTYDSVKKHTIGSADFMGAALAVLLLLGMSGGVVALALNARRRRRLAQWPSNPGSKEGDEVAMKRAVSAA